MSVGVWAGSRTRNGTRDYHRGSFYVWDEGQAVGVGLSSEVRSHTNVVECLVSAALLGPLVDLQ